MSSQSDKVKQRKYQFETRCIHSGWQPSTAYAEVTVPIYATSTYGQDYLGHRDGFEYGRTFNPTREAVEKNLASIELGEYALTFATGCAATAAILHTIPQGSKLFTVEELYGGTHRLIHEIYNEKNFDVKTASFLTENSYDELLAFEPDYIFVESPTNPQLQLCDIEKISMISKKIGSKLIVDNTFATPVLQNPLSLGADLVLHSTTKYIGGHSDLLGGALITSDQSWYEELKYLQLRLGATPSPFDLYLLWRSTKTLSLRVEKQSNSALAIAELLSNHASVSRVIYPHHPSHPQYALAKKQMCLGGGIVSFELDGGLDKVKEMISKLEIITLAESLGAVESLIDHPASMTHASIPVEERLKMGITDGLLRLSVGIESVEDLISDILNALN